MTNLRVIEKKQYLIPTIFFEEIEEECDVMAGTLTDGEVPDHTKGEGDEEHRGGRSDAKSTMFDSWSDDSYFEDEW